MNIYSRILNFVKPYKFMVFVSLISSFLFVLMNAFSLWMVSSLITTIMLPNNVNEKTEVINIKIFLINLLILVLFI